MLKNEPKQLSLYTVLYNKIPENHILKQINNAVDFSFINDLLKDSYSKYYGRPAKEPEMMAKLLVIQYLYDLSDVRVIEEATLNLAFLWFLGLNPEDDLPDPSLLAKFRTKRLQETTVDDIIEIIVRKSIEKGIITGNGISVDVTHVEANTTKKVPERIMKHLVKKIFKNLEDEIGVIPDQIDKNIPNYKEIEDPNLAKKTMKDYLEKVIESVEENINTAIAPKTIEEIEKAKDVLNSPQFIEQKGIRSLVDKDARVGYKSKSHNFFGYKVEFAMITGDLIITAINVHDGAYVDGTEFEDLYKKTKKCGVEIKEGYGDKAYFRKPILDILEEDGVEVIIPVSESVYRIDEVKYKYNKDSDQWFCEYGNSTVSTRKITRKNGDKYIEYKFDKEICRNCSNREECIKGKAIGNKITISINTPTFYEYSQRQKTPEFLDKYKSRSGQEWKNGEMKRFHGMDRARGYGLKSMGMQARLTALAVNVKRIAKLASSFLFAIRHILIKKCV